MAYYDLTQEENAILEIQRILRGLETRDNGISAVRLTGVFNTETRDATKSFQDKYGLPATGVVDYATWQVLQAVDKAQRDAYRLAEAVYILPRSEEYAIYPGAQDDVVYVIQHMLNVVGQEIDEIGEVSFTGVYDEDTQNAVRALQRKSLLESDGIISPATFNALAREYERINSYNQ